MDRFDRIKSLDEVRIAKDIALCELFPLKKKSRIIDPNANDPNRKREDAEGIRVIRVDHTEHSMFPDLGVGDIIIEVNAAPALAFLYKGKKYMAFRVPAIVAYTKAENYDLTLEDPTKPKKSNIVTVGEA